MKPKTWAHPKFVLLQRRLQIGPAMAAGILEGIWHLAATFDDVGGRLPYSGEELSAWLGLGPDLDGDTLVTALVQTRWLDEENGLAVHDWADHRPYWITDRLRKRKPAELPGTSRNFRENPPPASASGSGSGSGSCLDTWSMDHEGAGGEDLAPANGKPAPTPKRKPKAKPKRNGTAALRTAVEAATIAPAADALFRKCQYAGKDGGNLWGVAALLETGLGDLTESEVFSAAQGAALNGRDKPAHFFTCLAESLARRGEDLTELLRRVTITPAWPKEKPYARLREL